MELHPGQTAFSHGRHNLVETCIHENAVFLHLAGQLFRDPANQFSLDLPWAWSKNESHCVSHQTPPQNAHLQGWCCRKS